MQNNLISLLYLFLVITSCNQSKKHTVNVKNEQMLYLEEINNRLPRMVTTDDYWLIYRQGSIDFSSGVTVLCLPKNTTGKQFINCKYYSLNFNPLDYSINNNAEPEIIGHSFSLKNHFWDKHFDVKRLSKYHKSDLVNYIKKRENENLSGEGHCNNYFYISSGTDSVYILDSKSTELEKSFFKSLYRQISPSEYYQSFSLDNTCEKQWNLYLRLRQSKDLDTFDFKITYDIKGGYW